MRSTFLRLLPAVALLLASPSVALAQPAITATSPARNARAAPRATDVGITFTQPISAASATNVRVFSTQAGGRRAGAVTGGGTNTISFNPTADFKPGEVVSVTVPATVQSTTGAAAAKRVYQFTAAAGAGPGIFATQPELSLGDYSAAAACSTPVDVDGDGDLDLLAGSGAYDSNGYPVDRVVVVRNDGTGQFTVPNANGVIMSDEVAKIATGDIDGDGDIDFVTGYGGYNPTSTTVGVCRNNGTGTFSAPATGAAPSLGSVVQDVTLADVDGDGDLDLLAFTVTPARLNVLLNNGAGVFTAPASGASGAIDNVAAPLEVGDVDNDGDLDLVMGWYFSNGYSSLYESTVVRLNDGAGTFAAAGPDSEIGPACSSIALADIDGDGDLDMLLGASNEAGNIVAVKRNDGHGRFTDPPGGGRYAAGDPVAAISAGDFDGDGDLDLVTAQQGIFARTANANDSSTLHYPAVVRFNDGAGNFTQFETVNTAETGSTWPGFISVGDLDGDGDLDFVLGDSHTGTVAVSLNQPQPAPVITSFYPTSGPVGTIVTVNGQNLFLENTTVLTLNGAPMSTGGGGVYNSSIDFKVRSGASSGPIRLTTRSGTALTTTSFTVTAAPAPTISSFSPGVGRRGGSIDIRGTGFTSATQVRFGGVPATSFEVYSNQIRAVVPPGAASGPISIVSPGGTATSATNLTVQAITSISPTTGGPGTVVTIRGNDFMGATGVRFYKGAFATSFTLVNSTTITTTVPSGATSGPVSVNNSAGTPFITGPVFTVTGQAGVRAVVPTSVAVGGTVTVYGYHFTGTVTSVVFGFSIPFTIVNDTTLTMTMTRAGGGYLTVNTACCAVNPQSNYVAVYRVYSTPVISSFSPASGAAGQTVTLTGSFGTDVSSVRFYGANASFRYVNSTTLTATVPVSAITGTIEVFSGSNRAVSATAFVVPAQYAPRLLSFAPATGPVGTSVTITGESLTGTTAVTFNGTAAPGFTVNPAGTSLTVAVPAGAATGAIRLTNAISTATTSANFSVTASTASAPTLTSYSPAAGTYVSAAVTITGTNLTSATVRFNGTLATLTVNSATSISTKVPAGATTGPLTVTTSGGAATAATPFKVAPYISAFAPASGPVGTSVTITGTTLTGATSVRFGATNAASFTVNSATQITAVVAAGTATGKVTVTTPGGSRTTGLSFTVTTPATTSPPTLTSYSPAAGTYVGAAVTLAGTNLTGATVRFNGITANVTANSGTSISTTVPAGATTGPLTVTTANGTATAPTPFKVAPYVSDFQPRSGPAGTRVVITGTTLTGATGVKIGTLNATSFTVNSATQITAVVAAGAATGKVTVTTPGGTRVTGASFTLTGPRPAAVVAATTTAVAGRLPVAPAGSATLALWPNPARDGRVTVALEPVPESVLPATATQVQLCDAVGRPLRTATLPADAHSVELDLTGLAPGLYVVRAAGQVRRLVVE